MGRMMKKWGAKDEDVNRSFRDIDNVPEKARVYVISNEYEFFGASALLYSDVIGEVVDRIGTDCYILPSSVHDLVVLSTDVFFETDKLLQLVKQTNTEHVRLTDRLSDNVYVYHIEDGSITILSDSMEEVS